MVGVVASAAGHLRSEVQRVHESAVGLHCKAGQGAGAEAGAFGLVLQATSHVPVQVPESKLPWTPERKRYGQYGGLLRQGAVRDQGDSAVHLATPGVRAAGGRRMNRWIDLYVLYTTSMSR